MKSLRKALIGLTSHTNLSSGNKSPAQVAQSAVKHQADIDAIAAAGGAPISIPIGLDKAGMESVYSSIDGLLLPGGDDLAPSWYGQEPHPNLGEVDEARDELEVTFTRWALRDDMPVLGICRGIQVLAVAAGGTLCQDIPDQYPSSLSHNTRGFDRDYLSHSIAIDPRSRLATAIGNETVEVNSFHHQAVMDVPKGFVVSARSEDGLIEAIESPGHRFAVGVQCHPEGMWLTTGSRFKGLFAAFVHSASPQREQQST